MTPDALEDQPPDDRLEVFTVRLDRTSVHRLDRLCFFVPGANRSQMARDLLKMVLDSVEPNLVQMVARWQRAIDDGLLTFLDQRADPTQLDAPALERTE